jgi:hypothetical protein
MNRRQFITSGTLAGAVSATHPTAGTAATPKRALMKLGAVMGGGAGEGGGRFLRRTGKEPSRGGRPGVAGPIG